MNGMITLRSLKNAQNTMKAKLMAIKTGKVSPRVATKGCPTGFTLSLYPTRSITTIVATFAPLASCTNHFLIFVCIFSPPIVFCFGRISVVSLRATDYRIRFCVSCLVCGPLRLVRPYVVHYNPSRFGLLVVGFFVGFRVGFWCVARKSF